HQHFRFLFDTSTFAFTLTLLLGKANERKGEGERHTLGVCVSMFVIDFLVLLLVTYLLILFLYFFYTYPITTTEMPGRVTYNLVAPTGAFTERCREVSQNSGRPVHPKLDAAGCLLGYLIPARVFDAVVFEALRAKDCAFAAYETYSISTYHMDGDKNFIAAVDPDTDVVMIDAPDLEREDVVMTDVPSW
ncbi:hypothetical protein F5Y01DRAFT_329654, partial [Xylaria sp. FL0043]